MKSARAAAITADHCLTPETPDTSAENMSVYDEHWHERVAPNARTRLLMTHLMYMADNDRYDRFMQDMREFGRETLARANAGSRRALLKLLHLDDVPTLAKLARRGLPS